MQGAGYIWLSVLLAGSTGLVGLITYYAAPGENIKPALTGEARALRSAMARIEAESQGTLQISPIQAAPRTPESPLAVQRSVEDAVPAPPDGYSFVSFHGEMPRARIAIEIDTGDELVRPGPDWLGAADSINALAAQAVAAGRDWSFGWIRLAEGARLKDVAGALADLEATPLGSSGRFIRAQLPGDPALLQEIVALPQVDGLGAVPPWRKLSEAFAREASEAPPEEQAPVFITLMANDADGRWRQALADLGAVIGRFDPDVRAYVANVTYAQVESIVAADYVLAIEPVGLVRPAHDTAVPAMGADALRMYDGSPGIFSGMGGTSVPIGVMDTGLNINHLDIATHRESICGANFAWNSGWFGPDGALRESEDLWIDEDGHGTHVTGTIVGNGFVQPHFAGMAPTVRNIRFAKVLDSFGFGFGDSIHRGMDFLAEATECAETDRLGDPVKPLIVNMSLSESSRHFEGRTISERKLDSIVWGYRQLYIVAQSNESISGFSAYGAAKNSLAVGAILDSGDIAIFSSHGPTFDGRLVPQVVATGVQVHSARGNGSRDEYVALDGTSMASPTVAGVAALLMDAAPEHQEKPALARARLMASAIRPDPWLEDPDAFPATNSDGPGALQAQYGLGKASARTSILNRNRADGWIGGGAVSELEEGEYAYRDIRVPAGASRLDLVMTWDEPPAASIASTMLNDLDLWLDRDGDCGAGACGEWVSKSRVDNVEWIIVRNPEPGVYRAKVVARRVYTDAPRAALAWTVIRGASTPNLRIEADRALLPGRGEQELTLTVTADEYVAAGTQLHLDCRDAGEYGCDQIQIHSMDVSREDGVSVNLSDDVDLSIRLGSSIPLGEIAVGETQKIRFVISSPGEPDAVRLYFTASGWNAKAASDSVEMGSDGIGQSGTAQRPAHDDFAAAAVITGGTGSLSLDLLLATPEPGEPLFTPRDGRPAGSVWYRWRAPENGPVRFEIPGPGEGAGEGNARVDIFQGNRISKLERIASNLWGILFFAEKGQSYRVRVSNFQRAAALNLQWSPASRPVNDDFAQATLLEGTEGSVQATSRGATLEPGEWFGSAAGTTWFRWTAPDDGRWTFFSSHPSNLVLVFEGTRISSLRLVSAYPDRRAEFTATNGKAYRVAVATRGAYLADIPYELRWHASDNSYFLSNDDFAGAERIDNAPPAQHRIDVDVFSTVEPGEPVETGVRTRWWVWDAPKTDSYTWRLTDSGEEVPTYAKLQVTMFTGNSSEDLQLVAQTGPDAAPSDFVVEAAAGQRFWIAAGFRTGDDTAYSQDQASGMVLFGPTPGNDRLASAETISGTAGTISGSNRFATIERGERGSFLGHSSLWWTYEAAATGWQRFWLDAADGPWVLTVYKEDGDGFGGLEFVRSSHQPEGVESGGIEVIFHAEEGVPYTIRLGARGRDGGGEFTMNWEETEPPTWLRYSRRLADGDLDAEGTTIQLRGPSSLAFNSRGTALYAASRRGLQVFERDPRTGNLTFVQRLENDSLESFSLIWNPHRDELYAHLCGFWRRFTPVDDTQLELGDEETLSVAGNQPRDSRCSGDFGDVFMDDDNSFMYAVLPLAGRLQVLALDADGEMRHVQTLSVPGLNRAIISNSGTHVYTVTDSELLVIRRDANTGRLTQTAYRTSLSWRAEALAISSDDRYLFVFDDNGKRTRVFELEDDPSNPRELGNLPPFWRESWTWDFWDTRCGFASARKGTPGVDVFCMDMAFTAQWQPESGSLAAMDLVAPWQPDRFNNPVSEFGPTRNLATSPDGRHAYLDTEDEGLVIFERVGAGADPYVLLEPLSVSSGEASVGPVSGSGCIGVKDAIFDGVHYTVVNSKWQSRGKPNAEWADITGTETTGELCAYTPPRTGEYRLVAEIRIDGQPGKYSSNTIAME